MIKKKAIRRFYIFSIVPSMLTIILVYYFFLNIITSLIILAGIILYITPFLYYFFKWLKESGGNVRKFTSMMIIGLIISGIGYVNPLKQLLGAIAGYIIFIIGLISIAVGTWGLPSLSELDWRLKMHSLYILTTGGVCIHERSFIGNDNMDAILIGGGLTGVVTIVKEMTKSEKKLNSIQQEGRNILLEYGKYVNIALIAEEDLQILHDKIWRLRVEIESFFIDILPCWSGDVEIFKPISVLVDKTFGSESVKKSKSR